jgi:hypothetical protein
MVGNAINASLDSTLTLADAELSKLFEDRNILLTDGGTISFSGTQISFGSALKLVINSKVAGGSPVIVDLGSSTQTLANGEMWYAVVNRTAGTASTSIASTLPAVTSANQEVFLIAKRTDESGGTKRVYFRDGFSLIEGTSSKLYVSSSGGSDTSHGLLTIDLSAGSQTINAGNTLFYPNLTIDTPDTFSVSGYLISVNTIVINGTLTINAGGVVQYLD